MCHIIIMLAYLNNSIFISEPNIPHNHKYNMSESNVLTHSWTPGTSEFDVIHVISLIQNTTLIRQFETTADQYTLNDLEANALYEIELFAKIIAYPDTNTSVIQHEVWTCKSRFLSVFILFNDNNE